MSFRKLNDMALDLKELLEESGKVKEVRIAAITSYDQLQDIIPCLGSLPAAVVCFGTGEFSNDVSARTVSPGILVVDRFAATAEKKALGIWQVLEDVIDLFVPPAGPRSAKFINGVKYIPSSFRPIVCGKTNAAYLLELEAKNTR